MKLHVFPQGPLCSLRRVLLLWMIPMFLVVGVISAVVSYWTYSRMVSTFMDDQMAQLAQAIAANEEHITPPPTSAERVHKWGVYLTQVFDANGRQVGSSWPELRVGRQPAAGFSDVLQDGRSWRVYASPPTPAGHTVQVVQSGGFRAHIAAERAGAALVPVLVLLPLSMLVLWGLARMISRAFQEIAQEASQQDEHSIAELTLARVPREIAPLIVSFNSLLKRLRDAFSTQRRFVQDAAHELRTPIAAIGLQLENLRGDLPAGPAQQRFAQLEAGVRRAQRLVDQLLRLSRQEATAAETSSTLDLKAQLRESMNTLIALADQRNIDLGLVGAEEGAAPLPVRCATGDLRSLLDNLIENALRYTPEGGVVDVRLLNEQGRPAVEVVDTGPGIPPELLPRVFDRFFRVPGNGTSGSGLGLSIAQSAAQRCGLKLTLRNREDRTGLIARVEPAA
jgi:two-component system OmpR family sensor kinase